MRRTKKIALLLIALATGLLLSREPLRAADPIETAGIGVGVTAGNAVMIPAKAISVVWGLASGALSFVLSGGNADLTAQIWSDVTQGPYYITPGVARRAVGERPELQRKPMAQETAPVYAPAAP